MANFHLATGQAVEPKPVPVEKPHFHPVLGFAKPEGSEHV